MIPTKKTIIVIVNKKLNNSDILFSKKIDYRIGKYLLVHQGVRFLEEYFKKKGRNYVLYKWISKERFKSIIADPDNTIIYIFGHGRRYGLKFENGDFLDYSELKDYPKKEYVGQYHCNGGDFLLPSRRKSLADYIAKKGYVNNWIRVVYFNWLYLYWCCKVLHKAPDEL